MAQVFAPTMIFDYYVGLASTFAFDEIRQGLMGEVLVAKEPVGVVGAISPWNVPLFIAAAKLGPALVAGCTVVFKPAPETPLDALRLAELFEEAGLPQGVLSVLPAGREVGEHLVSHPGIDKVSFTGSTVAGKKIGAICGGQLKRFSLELGGKSAAILLDDVNLAEALPMLLPNAIMNNGEACIAQTRILAPRDRYQEVVDALVEKVSAMKVGDPLDPAVEVGPLVAERQRDRVEGYFKIGQDEGAKIAIGGGRPSGLDKGWFVDPTVFVDVDNSMRIAQEEIFGPVLAVIPYDGGDEEAVAIANDSHYGLCGSVWTGDAGPWPRGGPGRAHRHLHAEQPHPGRLLHPLRRLQGVGHGPGVRSRRPRALPGEEVDQPAGGLLTPGLTRRAAGPHPGGCSPGGAGRVVAGRVGPVVPPLGPRHTAGAGRAPDRTPATGSSRPGWP